MNRMLAMFAVLVSLVLSACALESDTPAPTTQTAQNPSPGGSPAESPKPTDVGPRVGRPPIQIAPCEPELVVVTTGMPTEDVAIGATNVWLHRFSLKAKCADMEIMAGQFNVSAPDFSQDDLTPFCAAPCSTPKDWTFQNLKIVKKDGTVIMGPLAAPKSMTSNSLSVLVFRDSFFLKQGEMIELEVRGDVTAKPMSSIAGKRFVVLFDGAATRKYAVLSHVYAKGVVWNATFKLMN